MSSLARGPTTTPPTMMPVPGRQNSFTKPSRTPCILARALPLSGSITASAWISPSSMACCDQPTVAISGAVKTLEETCLEVERVHGVAEEVPHRDPALHRRHAGEHQDAGAVAGGVDAPGGGARDPVDVDEAAVLEDHAGLLEAEVGGVGHRAEGEDAVRALDRAAVGQGHRDDVAVAGHRLHAGLRQHVHAAPRRDLLEHRGGVGVLAGQHPVARATPASPGCPRAR